MANKPLTLLVTTLVYKSGHAWLPKAHEVRCKELRRDMWKSSSDSYDGALIGERGTSQA